MLSEKFITQLLMHKYAQIYHCLSSIDNGLDNELKKSLESPNMLNALKHRKAKC